MVHNYSGGTAGKGHEIVDYINFSDKSLKETFASIYEGFLSKKELDEVIKGKDMWFTANDVRQRWASYAHPQKPKPRKSTKKVTKK